VIVYKCDLCGELRECLQKEIDGREYDVCGECWSPLEQKLHGKGRPSIRSLTSSQSISPPPQKEPLSVPPLIVRKEEPRQPQKPAPGEPPIVYGEFVN
jgi:hypothetical protein